MKLTIMGSGTSHGVPVISCDCPVCTSKDPHNQRYRASAFVTDGDKNIVIDTGPEFRLQAIRQGIKSLDAVLLTHGHADHLHGLDDIRMFSCTKQNGQWLTQSSVNEHGCGLKVFADAHASATVQRHYDYVFKDTQKGGGKPRIDLWSVEEFNENNPIIIGSMRIIPIPMMHGELPSTGYLFCQNDKDGQVHSIAYLTDLSSISEESIAIINRNKGVLDHAVIDALRERPHSTHFCFDQAMECARKIMPVHTWFTHLTHDKSHDEVQKYIDENLSKFPELQQIVKNGGTVKPAYDTLELA